MELSVVQKRFLELVAQDVVFKKRGMSYIFRDETFPVAMADRLGRIPRFLLVK